MRIPLPNWDDIFRARPPRHIPLPETLLEKPIARLAEIVAKLPDGVGGIDKDLLEEVRRLLRKATHEGVSFEKATKDLPRREWLLLNLYTVDLAAPGTTQWLPAFDEKVATSVLGEDPFQWHPARRRDVTQLFFVQFDRLHAVKRVAAMLQGAWTAESGIFDEAALVWARERQILFAEDGPERLAKQWLPGESTEALADRYYIHETSRFRERLLQAVLLSRLANLRFGADDPSLFDSLATSKTAPAGGGRLLGSRAVEIMVDRAIKDRVDTWPKSWSQALVNLACDPRIPNLGERQRWWGWATERQRDIAIKALNSLTIKEFIELLESSLRGTPAENQFRRRRDFLLGLFNDHRIIDARLVVNENLLARIDRKTRASLMLGVLAGGAQDTSVICLRCTDEVFLIEGTHSFGLRAFIGESRFPLRGFWNASPRRYRDTEFRIPEARCDIYQRHVGDWVSKFFDQLPGHLFWSRLYV